MATFDVGLLITAIDKTKAAFRGVNQNLQRTEQRAKRTEKTMRAINVVFAGIAVGSAVALSKSLLKVAGDFELMMIRLSTAEGGMKNAKKTYKELIDVYAASPFAIDAVANSFVRLRAAGLSKADTDNILAGATNAIAAFGGGSEELKRFSIGVQQAIGKVTLSMEEMRQQIGEAVPSAMRIMAKEMGITIPALFQKISDGTQDSIESMKFLGDGMRKEYEGTLLRLSLTIPGAMQEMSSQVKATFGEMAQSMGANGQVVSIIRDIQKSMVDFIRSISQEEIDNFFKLIRDGGEFTKNLGGTIRTLVFGITDFVAAISGVFTLPVIGEALGVGLFTMIIFGPKAGAAAGLITLVVSVGQKLMAEFESIDGLVKTFLSAPYMAAGFGALGAMLFGASGPVAFVAAAAGVAAVAVSKVTDLKRTYDEAAKGFIDSVKGQTLEDAKNSLAAQMKKLEETGGVLSRLVIPKLKEALAGLNDESSDLFRRWKENSIPEVKKGFEEIIQLIDGNFVKAMEKLTTLVKRLEASKISFGSGTATRFKQEFAEIQKVIDQTTKTISAAEIKFGKDNPKILDAKKGLIDLISRLGVAQAKLDEKTQEGISKYVSATKRKFEAARISFERFKSSFTDNALTRTFEEIDNKADGVLLKINNRLAKTVGLEVQLADEIADANRMIEETNRIREREKRIAEDLYNQQLRMNGAIERANLAIEIYQLRKENRGALATVFSSDLADKVEESRLRITSAIAQKAKEIADIQYRLNNENLNDTENAKLREKLKLLGEIVALHKQSLEEMTILGVATKELWKNVGDTIGGSVKSAMSDLIKGTFNAKTALLDFYDRITDAVIEYISQLIEAAIRQQILGAIGGGGGGGLLGGLGGLLGFKNGGAFEGNITPFASGGIVRGPTMFGLAGEAGTEAIMPLERIGGKLGVTAVGAGGDTFEININAIDTQTGAQFLRKNAAQIVNQMRYADRMNSGLTRNI